MTPAPSRSLPWLMLLSRTALFLGFQALIAAVYLLGDAPEPWAASVGWWTVTATLSNLVCIGLLIRSYKSEGRRYRELFRIERATIGEDLVAVAGVTVLTGVAAMLPNTLLATWLFGDAEATVPILFRPLPLWAIGPTLVLFPVTIALAEIPTYFGYVMPRLEPQIGATPATLAAAVALSAQHVTLPLVLDARFIVWRLLMFLPLALLLAVVLRWRPRLLPYLVVIHGLLDLSAGAMVLTASL